MADDKGRRGRGDDERRRRRAGVRGARARLGRRAARRRRPRAHRRDAPLHGARHGRGGPRPVPGREAGHRPRDRRRLLLRLRAAAPADARRPRGDRGAHAARASRPTTRSCARSCRSTRRGRSSRREGQAFKVEILDDLAAKAEAAGEPAARHDVLRARPVPRPVPRPARRVHGQDRAVQAARGLRRLLARRPGARVDAAHLRHGLGDAGGARPVPVAARGGEEARPPPAGRAARPVQLPRRRARRRRSGTPRAGGSTRRCATRCASSRSGAATRRSTRRRSCTRSCGSSPATGTCTATTCSWSRSRGRCSASSR